AQHRTGRRRPRGAGQRSARAGRGDARAGRIAGLTRRYGRAAPSMLSLRVSPPTLSPMQQKAPRRTRERILELSLRLFNEFGEPNITTTVIAEEMNISPGNLYYHFRNKDDIVNSIFAQFEAEIERILTVPAGRRSNMQDVWLYLHHMFELIWRYRF